MPDADGHGEARRDGEPVPAAAGRCAASSPSVLARVELNRYPDAERRGGCSALLARSAGRAARAWSSLLGNGSDEIIQMLTLALARPGAVMMYPAPTFVMYRDERHASPACATCRRAAARGLLARRRRVHRARSKRAQPALVFIAYPEQPDRQCSSPKRRSIAVIDAAPGPRRDRRGLSRVRRQDASCRASPEFANLLVHAHVSKLGLAGMRLGYLAGAAGVARADRQGAPAYNVNVLTQPRR